MNLYESHACVCMCFNLLQLFISYIYLNFINHQNDVCSK